MVKDRLFNIVVIICVIVVLFGMNLYSPSQPRKSSSDLQKQVTFTGLCIYSSPGFSILTDGKEKIAVLESLNVSTVYRVSGVMLNGTYSSRLKPVNVSVLNASALRLRSIRGALWKEGDCYLLTPSRIKLAWCINASKGELLDVDGIYYGSLFYPLRFSSQGYLRKPENGMPFRIEGVVIYTSPNAVLWNGTREIRLYLPYDIRLKLGQRVRALGIVRFYSKLTIIVESPEDIEITGSARKLPVKTASVGDIAEGMCRVINTGRALTLNCTELRLYGFSARRGDLIRFEAIRRKSSLYCLRCTVVASRNMMKNDICNPENDRFGKIEGRVKWVKVYKNGFGLANITKGRCWILLKLPKSLGISLKGNQTVTAFGTFTTYRSMPAFSVKSGEDVCTGRCS